MFNRLFRKTMYARAVDLWGTKMPDRLKRCDRSDSTVRAKLAEIIGDVTSPTWEKDSRIAWAILQGRSV